MNESWAKALDELSDTYPHSIVLAHSSGAFGIAFYSQLPIEDSQVVSFKDSELPTIVARVRVNGEPITVISTHPLPPVNALYTARRNQHLQDLAVLINSIDGPKLVLGGFEHIVVVSNVSRFDDGDRTARQPARIRRTTNMAGHEPTSASPD